MKSREIKIAIASAAFIVALGTVAIFAHSFSDPQSSNRPRSQPTGAVAEHTDVTTTVFWVGERSDDDNGHIPNALSAWDEKWQAHFGGVDDQGSRSGYLPAAFTPRENPFYVALPYNDIASNGARKATAISCRAFNPNPDNDYSWCKNIWVEIKAANKIGYAQVEDVGPFEEDDTEYVFGNAQPKNTEGEHAGLDISPALQTYFGLPDVSNTTWRFVHASEVPNGPWKAVITTSRGSHL